MRALDWLASLALLLAAPLAMADPTIATVGPRVTITAEALPLAEVVRQISGQINRRFGGPLLENPATAQWPVNLRLFRATVAQTLEALGEAVPCSVVRAGPGAYRLQARRVVPRLTQRLGDWTASVTWLRYTFNSQLFPGDLDRTTRSASLMPTVEVEAPSDAESMRLLALGPSRAVTDAGEALAPPNQGGLVLAPSRGDPALWMLSQGLAAPSQPATLLKELRCELSFFESLTEASFEFGDLAQSAEREASDHGYTARLAARAAGEGGRLLRVSISGPLPTGLEPNQVNSVLGRLGAGEGWLYNAAGEVEPSETRLDGFSAKDGVWESHWSVTQARPSDGSGERGLALVPATGPPPARLVMLLRFPAGPIVTVPAVFADLPLPPREEELPW